MLKQYETMLALLHFSLILSSVNYIQNSITLGFRLSAGKIRR